MRNADLALCATSTQEPQRLMRFVSGAIEGCGGWVRSRHFSGAGALRLSFEFERGICVEIYALLLASELILTPESHERMTEFCQCTYGLSDSWRNDLACVELEVETQARSTTLDLDPSRLNVA